MPATHATDRSWRKRVGILIAAAALAFAAGWFGQETVLSLGARSVAPWMFAKIGLDFRVESLRCGIGRPFVLTGVEIRESGGAVFGSVFLADRVEIVPNSLWDIVVEGGQLVSEINLEHVHAFIDLRRSGRLPIQPETPATKNTSWVFAGSLVGDLIREPSKIVLAGATIDVIADASRVVLEELDGSFEKGQTGDLRCGLVQVSAGSLSRRIGPLNARVAWDGRKLSLAGMEVLPGLKISEVDVRLPRSRDIAVSFHAEAFGGHLRGDIDLRDAASGRVWDVAVLGSNIGLDGAFGALGVPVAQAKGRLSEARFTFRGEVGRPADAEASFRVLAREFELNGQHCRTLDVAACLIQRRLIVSNFTLEQSGNNITANGEVSLAEGWSKLSESPFLINIRAVVEDAAALAKFSSVKVAGLKGRLEAQGSVSGRPGVLDGFLDLRAKDVTVESLNAAHVDVGALFLKNRIELVRCEATSGPDTLHAGGTIAILPPYDYRGWMKARVEDVSKFASTMSVSGECFVSSGALDLEWKGVGNIEKRDGEFTLSLGAFVTRWTPGGVTGVFKGGYTRDEVRLDTVSLKNDSLELEAKARISGQGVDLPEVVLKGGQKNLLEGKTFLPLDLFALRRGVHWSKALLRGRSLEIFVKTPGNISLAELMRLAGQEYPLSGSLAMELDVRGVPGRLQGSTRLSVSELNYGKGGLPPASLEVQGDLKEGALECSGRFEARGMDPVDAALRVAPFIYQHAPVDGRLVDASAPVEGEVAFPTFDPSLLQPVLPSLGHLRGVLSGELRVSGLLGAPRFDGEATLSDGGFSHALATWGAEGISGQMSLANGVVSISGLNGRIGSGSFRLSGTCRFTTLWDSDYQLEWNLQEVPLNFSAGIQFPLSGRLKAVGGVNGGMLEGNLTIDPVRIGREVTVYPVLSATTRNVPSWKHSLESISELAPFENWGLDISIGAERPLELGRDPLAGGVLPRLTLQGTAERPQLGGVVELPGLKVVTPGGLFFAGDAVLYLLPDTPEDPFLLVDLSGTPAGVSTRVFAWGPLSESKWFINPAASGGSTTGFWLLRQGMVPLVGKGGEIRPADVRLYPNAGMVAQPVSLRVVDDGVWCGGIGLSRSMDFRVGANSLPEQGYRPGFEWTVSPVP